MIGFEIGTGVARRQPEPFAVQVAVQQRRLCVGIGMTDQFEVVVDVAVGDETIGPAVVVEIGQAQPQPTQGRLSCIMPLLRVRSSNMPLPQIDEERVGLVPVVGDEQLGPAVAVDILGVDSHARADLALWS